jgi:hypothetical protein
LDALHASIGKRLSKDETDLETSRDILENLYLAATEPGGATYPEADAGVCRHYAPR